MTTQEYELMLLGLDKIRRETELLEQKITFEYEKDILARKNNENP
jgi:hypothetical protein